MIDTNGTATPESVAQRGGAAKPGTGTATVGPRMCYASVAIRDTMMRRGYEEPMRHEPHDMREMWIIMDLNDRSLTCLRLPGRHMHKRHDEAEKRGALAAGRIAWKAKRELASCAAGQWHTTRSGCTNPPKQQAHVIPRSYQRISRSRRTAHRLRATPYELQRSAHILPKNGLSSERCHHAVMAWRARPRAYRGTERRGIRLRFSSLSSRTNHQQTVEGSRQARLQICQHGHQPAIDDPFGKSTKPTPTFRVISRNVP